MIEWASLRAAEPARIGLAFTASHDGIGVLPMADVSVRDDLDPLEALLAEVRRRGGAVNMKSKVLDGGTVEVPYEACITWTQALLEPAELEGLRGDRLEPEEIDRVADRVVASASYVLAGPHCVPADYLGAIAGLLDDEATHATTGHHRDRNRGSLDERWFEQALSAPQNDHQRLAARVFAARRSLLEARRRHEAFSPHASCEVDVVEVQGEGRARPVYSVLRHPADGSTEGPVLCLTNASDLPQRVKIDSARLGAGSFVSLVSGAEFEASGELSIALAPRSVEWISSPASSQKPSGS
jgi:hypothetical protein